MKKTTLLMLVISAYISAKTTFIPRDDQGYPHIQSVKDACMVYPKTVQEVQERSALAQKEAKLLITSIIECPTGKQNKETMLYALDRAYAWLDSTRYTIDTMGQIHPDEAMRKECETQYLNLNNFVTEHLENNKALYNALKTYNDSLAKNEKLSAEEQRFLSEILSGLERAGLKLSDEKVAQLLILKKRCTELEAEFIKNINNDTSAITVTKEDFAGVSEDFIESLARDGDRYIVSANLTSYLTILRTCTIEATRKLLYDAFTNHAYPINVPVLQNLIATRDEYALLLGYKSYAHYDLLSQMAESPENVWHFLKEMQVNALPLSKNKIALMTKDLPADILLTETGKVKAWDVLYIKGHYAKKQYSIDTTVLAEYFPLEQTLAGLIKIYEQFFSIIIEKVVPDGMWHQDVQLVKVSTKDKKVLGYIFFDLFPREKKYPNACQFFGIDGMKKTSGSDYSAIVTVSCNFTKPLADKPSLLKFGEISTFFHECGHALHTMFAQTPLYYQSGLKNVTWDFIEMPSVMLENWLESPESKEILRMISCHYKTGQPLPDEQIDNLLAFLQNDGPALWVPDGISDSMLLLSLYE